MAASGGNWKNGRFHQAALKTDTDTERMVHRAYSKYTGKSKPETKRERKIFNDVKQTAQSMFSQGVLKDWQSAMRGGDRMFRADIYRALNDAGYLPGK